MIYLVCYDYVVVGTYEILGEDKVRFERNNKGMDILKKLGYDVPFIFENELYEGRGITFLDSRIRNSKRFEGLEYSNNFQDVWSLFKVEYNIPEKKR